MSNTHGVRPLRAAEKLQVHLDKRDTGNDVAKMIVRVQQILNAVKSTVPEHMWDDIAEKIEPELPDRYHAVDDETDDVGEVFDPAEIDEIDDEW